MLIRTKSENKFGNSCWEMDRTRIQINPNLYSVLRLIVLTYQKVQCIRTKDITLKSDGQPQLTHQLIQVFIQSQF
jgi:hypothetical protein